jgi:hypothetical protein
MKIISIAVNHIQLELDNGEVLDINDGTRPKFDGVVAIRYEGRYRLHVDNSEFNQARISFQDTASLKR